MAEKEEFSIIVRDGTQLFGYEFLVDEPLATLAIVHGLGEHAGRYDHMADFLNENRISVYVYDQRGHGLSEGKRGHTSSHERMLDDLEEILMYVRSEYNDLPLFVFGHSMGGNVVLNYLLTKNTGELQGAVVSTPWLQTKIATPKWQESLAKFLVKVFPSLTQSNGLKTDWLTNDNVINDSYQEDDLVHDRISLKLYLDFVEAGLWAIENADLLKLNTFVYHGADDPISSQEASEKFVNNAEGKATFHLYPNTKHEPHNDLNQKEVFSDVLNWINSKD